VLDFPVAGDRALQRDVTLPAGRYTLYCAIGAHAALGMRATLRVN
jgi:hypothetical protein